MADKREKAIDKGKEPKKEKPEIDDELSDQDVEKVAGGMRAQTDSTSTCKQCVTVC